MRSISYRTRYSLICSATQYTGDTQVSNDSNECNAVSTKKKTQATGTVYFRSWPCSQDQSLDVIEKVYAS